MDSGVRDRTLGDLVTEAPARAAILDRLGLDFCCHGQRSLADACREAGLDADDVAALLDVASPGEGAAGTSASTARAGGPVAVVDDILATHHRYLWEELPALEPLAEKVRHAHGERHPELAEVEWVLRALRAELEPHLQKEERVLFPAIRCLAEGSVDLPFGAIDNPIRVMEAEHEQAGELLARLRTITAGYAVPDDGCASYQLLYERLTALEADTHLHIHKENNVLFPMVVELEASPTR